MTPTDPRLDQLLAHETWLRRFATRLAGDAHVGEDLVQETFLAALRQRPSADRPLRPWLARVVRNQAALRLRRARSENDPALLAGLQAPEAPREADEDEVRSMLAEAVDALDEPYRTTLRQKFFGELSIAQIAALRDEPSATVRTRLRRGLARLKQSLEPRLRRIAGFVAWWLLFWRGRKAYAGALGAGAACVTVVALAMTSGAAGEPALAAGGTRDSEVARVERAGVRTSAVPRAIDGAQDLDLRAPHGTLLDDLRGLPVPDFTLRFDDGERALDVRTDTAGRFALPIEWAGRSLEVTYIGDDGAPERPQDPSCELPAWDAGRERLASDVRAEWALGIGVGPTLYLALEIPLGVELAELHAEPFQNGTLVPWLPPGMPGGALRRGAHSSEVLVRLDSGSWGLVERGVGELRVFSADGLWSGRARLDAAALHRDAPLDIELGSRAALSGAPRDDSGAQPDLLEIDLRGVDGVWRSAPLESDGRFRFGALEPGEVLLRLRAPHHEPLEQVLTLTRGEVLERTFHMTQRRSAGSISGVCTSATGKLDTMVLVVLQPVARDGERIFRGGQWTHDGERWTLPFRFDDVPAGAYELRLAPLTEHLPWDRWVARVQPGDLDLRFRCDDAVRTHALTFEALDADTGEPIPEQRLVYRVDDGPTFSMTRAVDPTAAGGLKWGVHTEGFTWTWRPGTLTLDRVPLTARIAWRVEAAGYEAREGEALDFGPSGDLRPRLAPRASTGR